MIELSATPTTAPTKQSNIKHTLYSVLLNRKTLQKLTQFKQPKCYLTPTEVWSPPGLLQSLDGSQSPCTIRPPLVPMAMSFRPLRHRSITIRGHKTPGTNSLGTGSWHWPIVVLSIMLCDIRPHRQDFSIRWILLYLFSSINCLMTHYSFCSGCKKESQFF